MNVDIFKKIWSLRCRHLLRCDFVTSLLFATNQKYDQVLNTPCILWQSLNDLIAWTADWYAFSSVKHVMCKICYAFSSVKHVMCKICYATFPEEHKSSSSQDLIFLGVSDMRWNNSNQVIAWSYCHETLPKSMKPYMGWTLRVNIHLALEDANIASLI